MAAVEYRDILLYMMDNRGNNVSEQLIRFPTLSVIREDLFVEVIPHMASTNKKQI